MGSRKRSKFLSWCFIIGLFLVLGVVLAVVLLVNLPMQNSKVFEPIATLNLHLRDDYDLETIRTSGKEIKYPGNSLDVNNGKRDFHFENAELKGRGNSTWGLPKSPYQIELPKRADILGLGAARKWILLANYVDDSNLRNDLAYKLANMLGEQYAVRGRFARLLINDEYQGLYYVTNKVEIDKNSVNLKDQYGVLVESDNLYRGEDNCVFTQAKVCFVLKDAVSKNDEEVVSEAMDQFMKQYGEFEQRIRVQDYQGAAELVDMRSIAEYYLVNEFASNPDVVSSSFFMYKDGEKDKIHFGPVWDFDYAFSNKRWIWGKDHRVFSPYSTMPMKSSDWKERDGNGGFNDIYYLMEMPEFRNEVRKLFIEKLSGRKEEIIDYLETMKEYIQDEAGLDWQKWEFGDFENEVKYLIDWVGKRYDFMERLYGRPEFINLNR